MLLTIDAGNTNTVFAVFDGKDKKASFRLSTQGQRTEDEIASFIMQLLQLNNLAVSDVKRTVMASVVPDVIQPLANACQRLFGEKPVIIGRDINVAGLMEVKVPNPQYVGDDRILNGAAAKELYGKSPAIVIDCGTATTFDVIDENGAFIGGVIAPGLNLAMQALYMAAAKLPKIEIVKPEKAIGDATIPAMQSGAFWGYIGLVEKILNQITAELPEKPLVIATGGLAGLVAGDIPAIEIIEPDLTLYGLRLLAEKDL